MKESTYESIVFFTVSVLTIVAAMWLVSRIA